MRIAAWWLAAAAGVAIATWHAAATWSQDSSAVIAAVTLTGLLAWGGGLLVWRRRPD